MTYTDTPLSTDISRESLHIQYDRSVKRILAYRPILARILQYTVKEVAGYTPDEIQNFINQEVEDMCNLSAGIWEDALIQGRSEGRIAGLEEGRSEGRMMGKLEGKLETLKMLVAMGKLALKDAAQAANMSQEEFKAAANI